MSRNRGFFITFEGMEGSGKTTQARRFVDHLRRTDTIGASNIVLTREPGGTPASEQIRDIFLAFESLTSMTELLLITAARAQHVSEFIRPALSAGRTVVCDRYIDTTTAYQGYRGDIPLWTVQRVNDLATDGLKPDLTFLLDLPPELGLSRCKEQNRLDREPLAFHEKVRNGYLETASIEPERIKVIDASTDKDTVHTRIFREYQEYLKIN